MINPFHIDASSDSQLLGIYFFTFISVLLVASLMLMFGKSAPRRRRWTRRHPWSAILIILAAWAGTLYGGGKGGPPETIPMVTIRLYFDALSNRYIPVEVPLIQVVK
jgi:apolipoprotein N-acyltransferase